MPSPNDPVVCFTEFVGGQMRPCFALVPSETNSGLRASIFGDSFTPVLGDADMAPASTQSARSGIALLSLRLLALILGTSALAGCGKSAPLSSFSAQPPSGAPKAGLTAQAVADAQPDVTLTAQELFDEFKKDNDATHKKYAGKVIAVSGTVGKLSDFESQVSLKIDGGTDREGFWCITAEDEAWARHGPGQAVTLKGAWPEKLYDLGGIALQHCVVVKAGPNPTAKFSAEQLAKRFEADQTALEKNFGDKPVIVEGEVAKKETQANGEGQVSLKGTGKVLVVCDFWFHQREQTGGIREGQKVKIYGRLSVGSKPVLLQCRLVTKQDTAQKPE